MRTNKGFTLIELVVTMLIAAILAAVAIPAYSNYVRKAHRTDAKNALLDMASLEERYFSTNYIYSSSFTDLGYGTAGTSINVGSGYYSVSAPVIGNAQPPTPTSPGTPATYSITAIAINDQFKDTSCRTFTITSAGVQTATDSGGNPATTCW